MLREPPWFAFAPCLHAAWSRLLVERAWMLVVSREMRCPITGRMHVLAGSIALSCKFVEVHGVELGGVGDGVDRGDAVLADGEAKDGDGLALGCDD